MTDSNDHPSLEFRVETLLTLIGTLCADIAGEFDWPPGDNPTGEARATALLEVAGRISGSEFGRALRSDVLPPGSHQHFTDEELISKWCSYDSGKDWMLTLEEGRDSRGDRIVWCTISAIQNPFTRRDLLSRSAAREIPAIDLCGFFTGYITGVIDSLLAEGGMEISHPRRFCMSHQPDLDRCKFLVSSSRTEPHPELSEPND